MRTSRVTLAGLLLAAVGCGVGEPQGIVAPVPVSGTVTRNGQPVKQGMLMFLPDPSVDKGREEPGSIANGKFKTSAKPGKYRVVLDPEAAGRKAEAQVDIPAGGTDALKVDLK